MTKKIAHATVAAIACNGHEAARILIAFIVGQKNRGSLLRLGNSPVIVIELSACIAHEREGHSFISLELTVALLVIARTPAVGALFVCFTFDLSTSSGNEESDSKSFQAWTGRQSCFSTRPALTPNALLHFLLSQDAHRLLHTPASHLLLVAISKVAGLAWRFSCKKKLMRIGN